MPPFKLRLYVSEGTVHSARARVAIEELCRELPPPGCTLEVIDVVSQPELAEQDRVLATPTLVRLLPTPVRKIVGDLSDRALLLDCLGPPPAAEVTT